jgi:hypothetical protein
MSPVGPVEPNGGRVPFRPHEHLQVRWSRAPR